MKFVLWSGLVLGLLSPLMAGEEYFSKTFDVNPGARLSLDSHKGHIQIATDGGSTIRVNARIYDGDPELMKYVKIRTRNTDTSVTIEVEYDEPAVRNFWKGLVGESRTWPYVDFEIVVPDDAALNIDSHKSSFDVAAPSGRIEIDSHKGQGTISGVRNEFALDTHKGDFDVEILNMHDVRVDTHKGNVNLRLVGQPNFTVRGDSHKGDIRFQGVDVPVQYEDRGVQVSHKVGNGRNFMDLNTHKGHIKVVVTN